jgi:drug/metabolite transporter (DMT)-like permease
VKHDGVYALLAAALFGASTPIAKILLGKEAPVLLAGLLYMGSGLGLGLIRLIRDRGWKSPQLPAGEWPWLLGAVLFGGVLGPIALLMGLQQTTGATASLLLNLEAVLTALIAWLIFKESADKRLVLGMAVIVMGSLTLSWPAQPEATAQGVDLGLHFGLGPVLIGLACLCWAIDNNLTRKVSSSDALFIAGVKGWVAGSVNSLLALSLGLEWPAWPVVVSTLLLGLLGYGLSLVFFVLALRGLGTARTGAYFSTAPFLGALISVLWLGDSTSGVFWGAALLMALGVWLHLSERHEHPHHHEALTHLHGHRHDEHHHHDHDFPWDGSEPHVHPHAHEEVTHQHPHYPDIHHRHTH